MVGPSGLSARLTPDEVAAFQARITECEAALLAAREAALETFVIDLEGSRDNLERVNAGLVHRFQQSTLAREALGEPVGKRLGAWSSDFEHDPTLALIFDEVMRRGGMSIDYSDRLGAPDHFFYVDREEHPELWKVLAELRWERASRAARYRGVKLPHLLDGERFSIDGYNFVVNSVSCGSLNVSLLDERGSVAAGMDLFHDIAWAPPVTVSKPLPRGARNRMYFALDLLGDLQAHLADKADP